MDGLLEFLILGRLPGTEFYIGYWTSMISGSLVVVITVLYMSLRSYQKTSKILKKYSKEALIELRTI